MRKAPRQSDKSSHPPYAEFMKTWEEGYVSDPSSFATMHTQAVVILDGRALRREDGSVDRERVREWVGKAAGGFAPTRLRLMHSALGLTPPAWVPDERYDLDNHLIFAVEQSSLEGTDLSQLSGLALATLSPHRPLWRVLVTPLEDGDIALGVTMHHAAGDALFTLKFLSALTTKADTSSLKPTVDPLTSYRAPRNGAELPLIALRKWKDEQTSLGSAWRGYWRRPFARRVKRAGGRIRQAARRSGARLSNAKPVLLPVRNTDYRTMKSSEVSSRAAELGGTINDLLVASAIRAARNTAEHVRVRVPVAIPRTADSAARNLVRDILVDGRTDAPLAESVLGVHAQLRAESSADDSSTRSSGVEIGYATVVPWLSRPRYFAGALIKEIIAFPTGLLADELSCQALLYNDKVTVVATTPRTSDASSVVDDLMRDLAGIGAVNDTGSRRQPESDEPS